MSHQYEKTPAHKRRDYDGNGKLSPAEIAVGVKLVKNANGTGWLRVDPRKRNRPSSIEDGTATKQNAEIDTLKKDNAKKEKENADLVAIVKDMEKRLRKIEGDEK